MRARRRTAPLLLLLATGTVSLLPLPGALASPGISRDEETLGDIERTRDVVLRKGVASRRLVVTKSRYRLDVIDDGKSVKVFPVAFGDPAGAKQRQGDMKTPEGHYTLLPQHPSPNFGSCFYVCYPGAEDARRGLAAGLIDTRTSRTILDAAERRARPPSETRLGGQILLHGTKDRSATGLTESNWTLGCIAMENDDVLELLALYGGKDRPVLEIVP